jgi:hypothetical protein
LTNEFTPREMKTLIFLFALLLAFAAAAHEHERKSGGRAHKRNKSKYSKSKYDGSRQGYDASRHVQVKSIKEIKQKHVEDDDIAGNDHDHEHSLSAEHSTSRPDGGHDTTGDTNVSGSGESASLGSAGAVVKDIPEKTENEIVATSTTAARKPIKTTVPITKYSDDSDRSGATRVTVAIVVVAGLTVLMML